MKRIFLLVFLLSTLSAPLAAQNGERQKGTVIRMRMTDCMPQHHFIATMSGGTGIETGLQCPEYVLMSDKVVYAISGKTSNQLLPLAEVTRFRLQNGEILIRIDDERKESRFRVKAMILRSDWERQHMAEEEMPVVGHAQDAEPAAVNQR